VTQRASRPPNSWGFLDHTQRRNTVGRIPLDEWSARRRDLYLTTHNTQQTNIHAPGGIRTHDLSRRAAADLRLRPRGHWDRQDATLHSLFCMETALHVSDGITTHHQERKQRYCYLPLSRQVAVAVWQIPVAVDTVACAFDDGWRYHPKHVEQFPDKINCVTLHIVGYILEYSYDARTHER
jgi:hypothetical protein